MGLLARLSLVVGILAGIAAVMSGAWAIFHQESTEVADYQSQVVATCQQVHKVLAAEHNEVFVPGLGNPGDPQVRRDVFLQVLDSNHAQARIAFDALNQRDVPQDLKESQANAVAAQRAWFAEVEKLKRTIIRFPRTAPASKFQELSASSAISEASATLNATMTALAGKNCQVTV
jgi:hypothetical protein